MAAIFLATMMAAISVQLSSADQLTIHFRLKENVPVATYVGSVAEDSGIIQAVSQSEFHTLRYNFLNPNDLKTTSYFSINAETGAIYTAAMIDRDSRVVCSFSYDCTIVFDATVRSTRTSYFEIVTVKVTVEDVNDNAPKFHNPVVTLSVSEAVTPGTTFRIDGASDPDRGANNSVSSYEMVADSNTFGLKVDHSLDGSLSVKLIVRESLDRERRSRYRLTVIAKDGGRPPLSGNLTLYVNVTDVNDNIPVFSENVYDFTVTENSPVRSIFGRVLARDKDTGLNGNVSYRFSPHKSSKIPQLFALNSKTGDISVRNPLQYESGNSFETVIEAMDNGDTVQVSQAILIIRIKDVGNNPPKITMNSVSPGVHGTVLLSEGMSVGTVVAHIKVVDNDQGRNGAVDCRSLNQLFVVQVMPGRGYNVQLKKKLDREKKVKHNLTVVCEDNGRPRMATSASMSLEVTDVNDNPPVFTNNTYYANITENNRVGAVVTRIMATDRDTGQNALMLYFMSLESDSMFRIDHQTGDITADAVFDRETLSQMTFTVKAVDEGETSMSGTATVIVTVLDQNDNQPYLDPSNLVFNVSEDRPTGTKVGQLTSKDRDTGINARTEYLMLVRGDLPPFVVFSDGVIRTHRRLNRTLKDRYEFDVLVKDGGKPSLNSTGRVYINVVDSNDHSPIILFPNERNNTVLIASDTHPGTVISEVTAVDYDQGINGQMSYFISVGNKDNPFHINTRSGKIVLARQLRPTDQEFYRITISVQDHGMPQQESQTKMIIKIVYYNTTLAASVGDNDLKYIIIAGAVGGVTVILSIIIVIIILHIKRADSRRRNGSSIAIQEQGDGRPFDKQLWHSVPGEEESSGSADDTEKNIDKILKGKMGNKTSFSFDSGAELDDPYLKKLTSDQYGGQQFYTFRKHPLHPQMDDIQSNSSGELTASDSGRGGSEEDIQLPPLPESEGEYSCTDDPHRLAVEMKDRRSHRHGNRPLKDDPTFQTFVPRLHPSFNTQTQVKPSFIRPIKEQELPLQEKRKSRNLSIGSIDDPLQVKRNSIGKRVTFANEGLTQRNLQNLERILHTSNHIPPTNKLAFLCDSSELSKTGSDVTFANGGSWYPRVPRSHDDDDNTTTSGSYTLNPEDIDEMFCETYPVS
ncbi:protocadherin-9-like [Haliotis rufescens]|uniref:protocadherin-9-like n=1 Tax=Haliotis rufescens TaxID=6454 RepID=UPI001EAFB2C4|nr:protocadherin-9-like [Haliotis rufescens]XP_046363173.1 protocadherin-9-like [Haliotis rufescens]XP_046363174.1 protocadherin-9-like [Haliotis rufescens]XP_046363175.1 protocadherin-9-like [Haliotis rufescens]XP_046363176.1 protocadherin-9-like [Haliotis rufescens]XP_046363177.1 protocadherin-9-like [Haliotis rufescens]XP_046363178.1 protocadherin-9-like [Haliotis rufescens]